MTVQLDVPFADARACDLRYSVDGPARPALASLVVSEGETTVDVRILGASHQVLVSRGGVVQLCETVACDVTDGHALPRSHRVDSAYGFAAEIARPDDLAVAVEQVVALVAPDPRGVVAAFPGSPTAVTAVLLESADPPRWRTWHAYPNTGELVETRSWHAPATVSGQGTDETRRSA